MTSTLGGGQPIEPTRIELSEERTDGSRKSPPPPPSAPPTPPSAPSAPGPGPGAFLPPPRRPAPPPAGPPAVPPSFGGGGGVAVAPPQPAPPMPREIHHHYYPVAAPAEPRFTLRCLRPVHNVTALVVGALGVPVTGTVLHTMGDEPGVMMTLVAVAGLLEARARGRSWPVRALTFNVLAASVTTASGLYQFGYLVTGVW